MLRASAVFLLFFFVGECFDPVVKADKFAQYKNEIGVGTYKTHYRVQNIGHSGKTIGSERISPIQTKRNSFLTNLQPSITVKSLQRNISFVNWAFAKMGKDIIPLYKFL